MYTKIFFNTRITRAQTQFFNIITTLFTHRNIFRMPVSNSNVMELWNQWKTTARFTAWGVKSCISVKLRLFTADCLPIPLTARRDFTNRKHHQLFPTDMEWMEGSNEHSRLQAWLYAALWLYVHWRCCLERDSFYHHSELNYTTLYLLPSFHCAAVIF